MLHTATFVVISLFTLSKSCNYVRDPSWEVEYCDDDSGNCWSYSMQRPGPIPLGYCQTNARNESESDYSEMFLCTSWGQIYHFSWNDTTCTGEPSDTLEVTSNSGYECYSADTCEIFNVRSNTLDSDGTCAEDTEVYDELVVVANECFVEADENGWRSIKAVCTSETSVSYQIYPDVIDCSGDYSVDGDYASVIANDGECAMTPGGEDGYSERYISVLNCGQVTPQDASYYKTVIADTECSYVANAEFTYEQTHDCWDDDAGEMTTCTYSDTQVFDVSTPMAGNMDADSVCTKRYEDGIYSSQLLFCADVIQMAFIATWVDEHTESRCQGPPVALFPITGATAMGCNNIAGPCPNMLLRISDFEEPDGTGVCGWNDNEWNEIRVTTDRCWKNDNDTYVEARCEVNSNVPSATYNIFSADDYADGTCDGDELASIPLANGGCYDFESDGPPGPQTTAAGNYSNFQILSCNDEYLAASEVIPDCKYVESPTYKETEYYEDDDGVWQSYEDYKDYYTGFKVPIGECITNERADETYSRIFICTPWEQVVVMEFFGNSCNDLEKLSKEPSVVEGWNNNCASENYCRDTEMYMKVLSNPTGAACARNDTDYDMNAFVPGCTNQDPVSEDGTGSTYVTCNGDERTVDYIVYDRPGCQGNELLTVGLDTDDTSVGDGDDNCDDFIGFVDLLECGDQDTPAITECSYIINPTWEQDGENRTRDGAIPLSTDLCMVEVDADVGVRSYMYWCDADIQTAFISWWNDTAGCTGYPNDVEIIFPGVEGGFQCTGDNGANCNFGFVTTSNIDSTDEDDCIFGASGDLEQAARLTDMCWPGYNEEDGTYTSWIVDCGVNAGSGELELEIQMYEGMDCSGELLNQLYIDDNECVPEFNEAGTQTYFDIAFCSKTDPIDGRPTTTDSVVSFCESLDQVAFGADGDYRDGKTDFISGLTQAKCKYCVCEGTDGDGFNPVCEAVAAFVESPICDIFIEGCTEAKAALTEYVGCDSYEEVAVKTDADGFVCGLDGFYCDTGTNTGDANMFKVSIISLFSIFMFVIY